MEKPNFSIKAIPQLLLKTPNFKEDWIFRQKFQLPATEKTIKVSDFLTSTNEKKKQQVKQHEENAIFSTNNAREEMLSKSLIKFVRQNKKKGSKSTYYEKKDRENGSLDPKINQTILNSIMNDELRDDEKSTDKKCLSLDERIHNKCFNAVKKMEINKSLVQQIIIKKMLEKKNITESSKFVQNFKVSRTNFFNKFLDISQINEKVKEKEKNPSIEKKRKENSDHFSFEKFEDISKELEKTNALIAGLKQTTKEMRFQIYLINVKIKNCHHEKQDFKQKWIES